MLPEIKIDVKNLLPEQQIVVLAVSGYIKTLSMTMDRLTGTELATTKVKYDGLCELMNKLRIVVEMDSISEDIFGEDRAPSYRTTKEAIKRVLESLLSNVASFGGMSDACNLLLKPHAPTVNTGIRTVPSLTEQLQRVERSKHRPFDPTSPSWPLVEPTTDPMRPFNPGLLLPFTTITS